jgi:hypothetical protein
MKYRSEQFMFYSVTALTTNVYKFRITQAKYSLQEISSYIIVSSCKGLKFAKKIPTDIQKKEKCYFILPHFPVLHLTFLSLLNL